MYTDENHRQQKNRMIKSGGLFCHVIHITASFGLIRIKNPWCRNSIVTCHSRSTHDVYPKNHARNALQQSSAGIHKKHMRYNHSWKVFGYFRCLEFPIKFTIIPYVVKHKYPENVLQHPSSCSFPHQLEASKINVVNTLKSRHQF